LKKWGEGASLIRKEWKTRGENDGGGKEEGGAVDTKSHRAGRDDEMAVDDEDDDDEEDEEDEEEEEEPDLEATPRMLPRRTIGGQSPQLRDAGTNNDLTNLTESLNSLSIVPTSIRFGRGGKSGGFMRGRGRPRAKGSNNVTV
jgi:hypothetical protein